MRRFWFHWTTEGIEVETTIREGKFGLIVMGARDMSKIKEALLESESDGVIRNAPCPFLITK